MIYALLAILAVMVACVAFGYVLRGLVNSMLQQDPPEELEPDCKTCQHEKLNQYEEPCKTCLTSDVSMWEAKV